MSAFLGPIHYWLYNKIQLQQEIVDELYIIGEQFGLALKEECDNNYGIFENKPLEEIIDQGNIHGWLQERVSQVEYKYAYVVTTLLEANPEVKEQLQMILSNKGRALALSMLASEENHNTTSAAAPSTSLQDAPKDTLRKATDLYKIITDQLLDGMPCDHANRLLSQSDTEVTWTRNLCVHSRYWEEVVGDINLYYELREAWIEAFVQVFGFTFVKVDEATYRIMQ